MLSVLVDGVETDLWALDSFKCFIGVLSFNIIYPALILAFPHSAVSRVGAACMDAALDLSYMVVWLFLMEQLQHAPWSNFDRFPTTMLAKLASHDFWNYMSVYFSVAHVCCVCRSLEQINWPQLLQFRPRKRSVGQRFTRMMFAVAYALGLFLTLWELLKQVNPDPCSPCRCSSVESNGLKTYRLESCSAAAIWNIYGLKLGGRIGCTISDISPDALRGLTKLRTLRLSDNGLKELPEGGLVWCSKSLKPLPLSVTAVLGRASVFVGNCHAGHELYHTSRAGQAGGGSFKREKNYKPKKDFALRSVCDNFDWLNLFLMARTKVASVGFVTARNCMRQQVLDDAKSLPNCGRSQSAMTCDSSYAPTKAQYYSVLQSTTKYHSAVITNYYKRTTPYYKALLQYYSVLQRTTPVLLCTSNCYYVLLQYYSVLWRTIPVLLQY